MKSGVHYIVGHDPLFKATWSLMAIFVYFKIDIKVLGIVCDIDYLD